MSIVKTLVLSSTLILQSSALLAMETETRYPRAHYTVDQVEEIEEFPEYYISNNPRALLEQIEEIEEVPEDYVLNNPRTLLEQVEEIEEVPEDYIPNNSRTLLKQLEGIEDFSEDHSPSSSRTSLERFEEIDPSSDKENLKTSADIRIPPGSVQNYILEKPVIPQHEHYDEGQNTESSSTRFRDFFMRNYSQKFSPFTNSTPDGNVIRARDSFMRNYSQKFSPFTNSTPDGNVIKIRERLAAKQTPPTKKKRLHRKKQAVN